MTTEKFTMRQRPRRTELLSKVQQIGEKVVRPAAEDVDRSARFPSEAFEALREESLLAASISEEYGGLECSVSELVAMTQILARHCASTAMIWAMHQIQLGCISRHGLSSPFFRDY